MDELITLTSSLNWKGVQYQLKYQDLNSFKDLPLDKCMQVYAVCFHKDKMVIAKGTGWGFPGGHIEKGETFEQTLKREIQEETNMKVLKFHPVGCQIVTYPDGEKEDYQLRYMAIVEPMGKFEQDPTGSVTAIKKINPRDYKKYIDWGEIGERIVKRACSLKNKLL